MDEYVIIEKSILKSMADTIRDTLGSTDSIAVTDLSVKLLESIEAVGGGKFASGTIVLAKDIILGPGANFEIETGFLNETASVNFVMLLFNGTVAMARNNTHFIAHQNHSGETVIAYKTVSDTSAKYDTMYYDAHTYFDYDHTTGVVTLNGKSSSQILNSYYGNSKISWAIWVD